MEAALTDGFAADPAWDGVFAGGPGLQSSRAWLASVAASAVPKGAVVHLVRLTDRGAPAGLLPLLVAGGRASGLTSPYTVLSQPLVDPARARDAGLALGQVLRRWPTTVLDALDPAWPGLVPLLAGLRRAGLVALRFDQFGNWHETVPDGWDTYLAARPGALRETLRRKGNAAAREKVRFEVITGAEGLEAGLAAYERVYASSWKVPEPYPDFAAALLHRLAPLGRMRLGVLWRGDTPLAAQYWTVAEGNATVLKLAHDDAAKALSPGTLLTGHIIRALLEEGVRELDFGRGDDPYKRQWAGTRRQRVGVVLANPLHPAGLAAIARHAAGALVRRARR